MEKRHLTGTTLLVAATLVLSGCGGLGKMKKYVENIKYTVDPEPLIVQGDSVALNINGNFPGKYFHKKAMVELTPTLVYGAGSTPYKTVFFQGENAPYNHTVIPYETGKSFTYSDKVAYTPDMQESELMLMILGRQGNKEMPFDPFKLGDGVITTPYLMLSDDKVLLGADRFQRITTHTQEATINYLVNSSVVRPSELTQADAREMTAFTKASAKRESISLKGVEINAWASPEGELSLNENLASDRAKSAAAWLRGDLTRNRYEVAKAEEFFQLKPRGEDWDGFKKAMQASNIADRDLVLRVLEMYPDLAKREQEIRNMAATYKEIADNILPALRRSEVTLTYDRVGRSDERIAELSRTHPDSLNAEEMLYAATLTEDINEKMRIYKETERLFPQDYRGANNVGYIHMLQNRMADAESQFQKANSIEENPVSTNNLGVIARLKGDRKKAAELFKKAMAAGPEVKYNHGLVDIQNGNYGAANSNMAGMKTFNAALAKVLGGDAAGAGTILNDAPEKDTAMGHYLAAIIAARTNNGDAVRTQLGLAVQKDASLREKALKDLEFRNFKGQLGL
jgi:tetratricopeptide (TPR) repeat protein